eukprot:scaffold6464_cov145-Skeletonema_menzelii.AAC.15
MITSRRPLPVSKTGKRTWKCARCEMVGGRGEENRDCVVEGLFGEREKRESRICSRQIWRHFRLRSADREQSSLYAMTETINVSVAALLTPKLPTTIPPF